MQKPSILFVAILILLSHYLSGQTLQLPVIADNSIVMVDGEWTEYGGSKSQIRIKGNQHIVAMAFDLSAIQGKRVRKATLVCTQGAQTISGVSISTIATPWDEFRSNGLTAGKDGIDGWGYPGARFPAAMGGNGNTLIHQADSILRDGKYYWDVDPEMVHAMVQGIAHGLAIHEHDADTSRNPTIFSREQSAKKPYLEVDLDGDLATEQKAVEPIMKATESKPESIAASAPSPKKLPFPQRKPSVSNLSVIPLGDKYDATGKAVGSLPQEYRSYNSLFDGQQVHLIAAAGEVVGFQVLLRGTEEVTMEVTFDDFHPRIDLLQAIYVPANGRMIPDPLIPISSRIRLEPESDQSIVVDIYIPFDAKAGARKGAIKVSDGRTVPIDIQVLPSALPRKATFLCEMNGYGLPDHVDDYFALQQVAYDHRTHANILHYSHHTAAAGARKSNLDMRLRSGKRMDNKRYDNFQPNSKHGYWDDFVEAFGPFLDGSIFKDGHRGPIPAPGFYLTFHESWPLNCRPYFNGNLDAYQAFTDDYKATYQNILKDFQNLALSKGWTDTGFQIYFNNKGSLREVDKSPWILDEPSSYWDYRALRFFGDLSTQALRSDNGRSKSQVQIDFRIDISRPEFTRGQLKTTGDLWVVSSDAFKNYRQLLSEREQGQKLKVWVYGSSNHVHESNRNIQAWAIDAWLHGANGIVPWQTINKTGSALKDADQLGLFIFAKDKNSKTVVHHSLRLKAYREAQQLIEHFHRFSQLHHQNNLNDTRHFIRQFIPLDAQVDKVNEADAGTSSYRHLSPLDIDLLRVAIVK